jgi:hypothetical protein
MVRATRLRNPAARRSSTSKLGDDTRRALNDFLDTLELSYDEAGRLFGVSGETVRRWALGNSSVPLATGGDVLLYHAGVERLQAMFQPERLPSVIRRSAELFDGERAIDWIMRGRIAEVAGRYERILRYQA